MLDNRRARKQRIVAIVAWCIYRNEYPLSLFGRLTMSNMTFGAGLISPQLLAHIKRTQETAKAPAKTEFGGGLIAPAVTAHIKRSKVEFGGGLVHPHIK